MTDDTPLASLFRLGSDSWASWSRLGEQNRYSQLHSKFWGKKTEEEAHQWRTSHPNVMDDEDEDIGPGCYALNLDDIGDQFLPKLWVRKDYIRIYDYCSERANATILGLPNARSVIITGQPGVGKTFWITYAIRRRLGEQLPFLWYRGGACFLFVEDGVFHHIIENVPIDDLKPFLWAFVDADEPLTGIPERLIHPDAKLYIMFTTSPERERWKRLEKSGLTATVIMNPWSLEELGQATDIRGFTKEQKSRAVDAFKKYGPIPRVCIDFVADPPSLMKYDQLLDEVASGLTVDRLRHFTQKRGNLDLDAQSHALFIVRRSKVENLERAYLAPISADAEMRIMTTIDTLQRLQQRDLYHSLSSVPMARGLAGVTYESLCYTPLQDGVRLRLKPMIKRGKLRTYFHWKSQAVEQTTSSMEVDDSVNSVTFPANNAIVYEGAPTSIEENRLYVPKARNQVALDSFFKLGQTLYIFQLTMAIEHSIKEGVVDTLFGLRNKLPPGVNWLFLFITPGGELDVKAKATSGKVEVVEFLERLELYSADLEFM